jgi:hypothetical protein
MPGLLDDLNREMLPGPLARHRVEQTRRSRARATLGNQQLNRKPDRLVPQNVVLHDEPGRVADGSRGAVGPLLPPGGVVDPISYRSIYVVGHIFRVATSYTTPSETKQTSRQTAPAAVAKTRKKGGAALRKPQELPTFKKITL